MSETESTSRVPGLKPQHNEPTADASPKNSLRAALAADCGVDRREPIPMAPYDPSRASGCDVRYTAPELAKITSAVTDRPYQACWAEALAGTGAQIDKRPLLQDLAAVIGVDREKNTRLSLAEVEALCRHRGLDPETIIVESNTEEDR